MIKLYNKGVKFYKKDKSSFFKRLFNRVFGVVMQNKILKRIKRYFVKQHSLDNWIIILSNYNSGSTLLRNILSAANEISYFPDESVLYTDELKRPDEEYGWQRNWVFCEDKLRIDKLDKLKFERYCDDVAPALVHKKNSKFILEKSISNITRISWFENHCKSVKFLAIVRDPVASCEGMSRKSKPIGAARENYGHDFYKIEDLAKQYKMANDEILRYEDKVQNFKIIKYEDLCKNPNGILRDIFHYLDLDKNQLSIVDNRIEINGFRFEIKNLNFKSYKNITSQEADVIWNVNKSLFKIFGYDKIK